MKYILPVALTIIMSTTSAQQIQNVKAVQQGTKVLVSYDLNDQSGKPYYVKLLMSRDGGTSFGDELIYVSGDVKNSKAGIGKKILWDASQEISYYDGDAVFRVEAILKAAPMPDAVELDCSKVELVNARAVGNKVTVDFIVTSVSGTTTALLAEKGYTSLFDTSGNEFGPSIGKLGDSKMGSIHDRKTMIKGVPVKSQLVFDNVPTDVTSIAMLKIYLYSNGDCNAGVYGYSKKASFEFTNVPISR